MARINHQIATRIGTLCKLFRKGEAVTISSYLDERLVLFLDAESRDQALSQLVDHLAAAGQLQNKDAFHRAILVREGIVSTGIGIGVAIPHAKLDGYQNFFIAIGIQQKRGLEWDALDGSLVRLIFMIGGPENKQTEYLKILSHLTVAIKDEERRKKILKASSPSEVISLFQGC